MIDPLIEDVPFVISNNDGKTVKTNWNQLNNEVFLMIMKIQPFTKLRMKYHYHITKQMESIIQYF